MLISYRARFLFVHIQKTAGTSLRQALHAAIPDLQGFLGTHDRALQAKRHLGEEAYSGYFTAAFVRNPWERLVAWYAMIAQWREHHPLWRESWKLPQPRLWRYVLENSSSFEEFVLRCTAEVDDFDGRKSFCWNQLDYLVDERGRRIVEFIGRYEHFHSDAQRLFDRLGLRDVALPRLNVSSHHHYSAYYSDELADVVRQRYQRDLAAFGYEFVRREAPGTAN